MKGKKGRVLVSCPKEKHLSLEEKKSQNNLANYNKMS